MNVTFANVKTYKCATARVLIEAVIDRVGFLFRRSHPIQASLTSQSEGGDAYARH